MSDEPMYGVKEAAKFLGLKEPMVRYYTRKGALQCQRVIGGTAIVYTKAQIDAFIADMSGLTTMDVAILCGVTPAVVGNWVHRGELPSRKSLINELRFDLVDVQKFATERGIQLREVEVRKAG